MRTAISLKGCHRCGGDVYLDSDSYGDYVVCLQCGCLTDADPTLVVLSSTPQPVKPAVREVHTARRRDKVRILELEAQIPSLAWADEAVPDWMSPLKAPRLQDQEVNTA